MTTKSLRATEKDAAKGLTTAELITDARGYIRNSGSQPDRRRAEKALNAALEALASDQAALVERIKEIDRHLENAQGGINSYGVNQASSNTWLRLKSAREIIASLSPPPKVK